MLGSGDLPGLCLEFSFLFGHLPGDIYALLQQRAVKPRAL